MYLHVKCSFKLSTVGIASHDTPRTNSDLFMTSFFLSFINDLRERGTHDVLHPNFTGAIVTFNRPRLDGQLTIVIDRCQSVVISCGKKALKDLKQIRRT